MDKINRIQNQGIASTEARRQGALRLLRFAAALAGDSTPLLRLKRLGMAERFLSARTRPETTTPLFPRKQPFFGSARSGPGRGTRRSEPLTARTDLESCSTRGKGYRTLSVSTPFWGAAPSLPAGINTDDSDPLGPV